MGTTLANPQVENGYIRISNDVWDALVAIRISGEARQVLDFIIRKTWGWGKKTDRIPLSQFRDATGLRKSAIIKARQKLLDMRLITVTQKVNDSMITYGFIKDYRKWKPLPKKRTITQKVNQRNPKSKFAVPKKRPSIDNASKDTYSKDKPPIVPLGGNEIEKEKFDKFINLYPNAVAKAEAWEAWQQLFVRGYAERRCTTQFLFPLTDDLFSTIIGAVEAQIQERTWKREAKVWIASWTHPATWLRAKRWEDKTYPEPEYTQEEEHDPFRGDNLK